MPTTALVTSEQYLALPDEFDQSGERIRDELIGGEIVKMPPASLLHDRIKTQIFRLLMRYLDANPQLDIDLLLETGTEVGKYDTYVPDISLVRKYRLIGEARILRGSPDLAVEIASPSDRAGKLKKKLDAYLAGGAKSIWVVFPKTRTVAVYSPASMRELTGDDKVEDALLPGFSTPVPAFFDLG